MLSNNNNHILQSFIVLSKIQSLDLLVNLRIYFRESTKKYKTIPLNNSLVKWQQFVYFNPDSDKCTTSQHSDTSSALFVNEAVDQHINSASTSAHFGCKRVNHNQQFTRIQFHSDLVECAQPTTDAQCKRDDVCHRCEYTPFTCVYEKPRERENKPNKQKIGFGIICESQLMSERTESPKNYSVFGPTLFSV